MDFSKQLDYGLIANAYKKMKECKKCQDDIENIKHIPIGQAYELHLKDHNE